VRKQSGTRHGGRVSGRTRSLLERNIDCRHIVQGVATDAQKPFLSAMEHGHHVWWFHSVEGSFQVMHQLGLEYDRALIAVIVMCHATVGETYVNADCGIVPEMEMKTAKTGMPRGPGMCCHLPR